MRKLHLVQGGIANGDKKWIERAARNGLRSTRNWVVPKTARIGDEVVLYIGGFGFFATGRVYSQPTPRTDWQNRYGAGVDSIKLIEPPISLGAIRRNLPDLKWAVYPRSIATPTPELADSIKQLIRTRRITGIPDLEDDALDWSSLDELRAVALLSRRRFITPNTKILYRARSKPPIPSLTPRRSEGNCEGVHRRAVVTPMARRTWKPII